MALQIKKFQRNPYFDNVRGETDHCLNFYFICIRVAQVHVYTGVKEGYEDVLRG